MFCDKRAANAMGGKTVRACDGCMRKRARWYCVADDAFLCQACDTSVHSANQLASRHERVRLETASSSKFNNANSVADIAPPAWHQGFTRKARTPRQNKSSVMKLSSVDPVVPEIGVDSEDGSVDENENEEQMVRRVPVFDPFSAELCNNINGDEEVAFMVNEDHGNDLAVDDYENEGLTCELNDDLLPSDLDLAVFAADVESLIGSVELDELDDHIKGLDELLDNKEKDDVVLKVKKVKDEEEEEGFDSGLDMTRAWSSFEYESPPAAAAICEEEEKVVPSVELEETLAVMNNGESNKLLRLNYESVISAWASQGSPWTTGTRPQLNPNDFMGTNPYKLEIGGILNREKDGEREARVTRYREKRRTRLFSKKIRYQVRKLNAEKRPRMKGRFVKRTSSSSFLHAHPTVFPYSTTSAIN